MLKKSILTALLVAMSVFAFSMAQAAQIDGLANAVGPAVPAALTTFANPGGMGDALIFGYYNAAGAFNYMRIVNTSTSAGVAVKVRFREGKNSNEVLDFFVCLSAGDMFSGWISDFGGPTAKFLWWDNDTPTFPDPSTPTNNIVTDNIPTDLVSGSIAFASGSTGAASSVTDADTKEGYVEVIAAFAWADTPGNTKVVRTPNACGQTVGIVGVTEAGFTVPIKIDAPNSLMGNLTIVKGAGVYNYNATALANFRDTPLTLGLGVATDNPPRLDNATNPAIAVAAVPTAEAILHVNYALTKTLVNAVYDIEAALGAGSDVILSFPTKSLSITNDPGVAQLNGPFNDNASIDATGAIVGGTTAVPARCERVDVTIWNDAEAQTTTQGCLFSPCVPQQVNVKACNEVSVFTIGGDSVLESGLVTPNSALNAQTFELGWINFDLRFHEMDANGVEKLAPRSTTVGGLSVFGLPLIGYQVGAFLDGSFASMAPAQYHLVTSGGTF